MPKSFPRGGSCRSGAYDLRGGGLALICVANLQGKHNSRESVLLFRVGRAMMSKMNLASLQMEPFFAALDLQLSSDLLRNLCT